MRFNNNDRQRTSETEQRVERIIQQVAGQQLQQTRRSNTVGLKIPFLVADCRLVFDVPNQFYQWQQAVGRGKRGSEIDCGIMIDDEFSIYFCQLLGTGTWLICASVDIPVGTRLVDGSNLRDRVTFETEIRWGDANQEPLWLIYRHMAPQVWESTALSGSMNLWGTTATHRAWFVLATEANRQVPRPSSTEKFQFISRMTWERMQGGARTPANGRDQPTNASLLFIKLDSFYSEYKSFKLDTT